MRETESSNAVLVSHLYEVIADLQHALREKTERCEELEKMLSVQHDREKGVNVSLQHLQEKMNSLVKELHDFDIDSL